MNVGLALSGGAARGIAHIGVLQYLSEREVKPVCIAGTSAGSIAGALYCTGRSIDEITEIVSQMSWKELIKLSLPRKGIIKSSRLLNMLKDELGDVTFDQLETPLIVNAVDLLEGEELVMTEGPVAEAVAASCAIPGIFTPVRLEDRLLVDGGLLNNLPSAHLKERDVDFIIAVNVTAQKPLHKEPETIFEVLIQSYDIIRRHRDIPACSNADALVEPDLTGFNYWDTGKSKELIEKGYQAAAEALDNIDLYKKQSRLARWFSRRKSG